MWNDTYFAHNAEVYLECFQGDRMIIWAGIVVVVEGRVGGRFD